MNQQDCHIYSRIFINAAENNDLTMNACLGEQGREWEITRAICSGLSTPLAYPYSNVQASLHEDHQLRDSTQKSTLETHTRWPLSHQHETLDPKNPSHKDTAEKPTDCQWRGPLSTDYERKSG